MNVFSKNHLLRIIPALRRLGPALCLFAALSMGQADAQPTMALPSVAATPDLDGLPTLASYSGTYDIALVKAAQMEGVRAVSGKMIYTLIDRCDGYTLETEVDISLTFSNGLTNRVLKRYAGWEAKDGRRATYRMQIYENGELEDTYTGIAELEADGSGQAVYVSADTTTFDLPVGTVLSTRQLREMIRAGQNQSALLAQSVMDGAFEDGPYRTSSFIAPIRDMAMGANAGEAGVEVTDAAADLLNGPYWPVTMAYFPLGKNAEVPEYELDFQVLSNGVIRAMTQDYGAYTLSLRLTGISPRNGGC
jgi:EipB-like